MCVSEETILDALRVSNTLHVGTPEAEEAGVVPRTDEDEAPPPPRVPHALNSDLGSSLRPLFPAFGPRIGVESIADVLPGQRGRQVNVSDLKLGLE